MKKVEEGRSFRSCTVRRPPFTVHAVAAICGAIGASGCAQLATNEPRAARSSLGCMRAAIAQRDFAGLSDVEAHCIAAGLIARRCSVSEAMLAGVGKEIRDVLGPGDAEWRDLSADRKGLRCARESADERELLACCRKPEEAVGG